MKQNETRPTQGTFFISAAHRANSVGSGCDLKGQTSWGLVTVVLLSGAMSEDNLCLKGAGKRTHFPVLKSIFLNIHARENFPHTENPFNLCFSFQFPSY